MEYIKPMSGSEVARHLSITRQTVSTTTKRALGKMYDRVREMGLAEDPFDIMLVLMSMCQVDDGVADDVKAFLNLFPDKIQNEVMKDAEEKGLGKRSQFMIEEKDVTKDNDSALAGKD